LYVVIIIIIIIKYLACRKPKLQGQVTTTVTVRQPSNDCVNKKIFKRCLKVATDDAMTTVIFFVMSMMLNCLRFSEMIHHVGLLHSACVCVRL